MQIHGFQARKYSFDILPLTADYAEQDSGVFICRADMISGISLKPL